MQTGNDWQEAYLLHRRPWKEHGWLVDFFTRGQGRIRLIAQGVRKKGRRAGSVLEPFTPLRIQWRGRSDLPVLTQHEPMQAGLQLHGLGLYAAFYLNELLFKLFQEGEASERLYLLYHLTLQALQSADSRQVAPLLRRFELLLLETLGHGLDFGSLPETPGSWRFDLHQGWVSGSGAQPGCMDYKQLQKLSDPMGLGDEQLRLLKPVLQHMLQQLKPGVGEQSRALVREWMKLKQE